MRLCGTRFTAKNFLAIDTFTPVEPLDARKQMPLKTFESLWHWWLLLLLRLFQARNPERKRRSFSRLTKTVCNCILPV